MVSWWDNELVTVIFSSLKAHLLDRFFFPLTKISYTNILRLYLNMKGEQKLTTEKLFCLRN